MAAKDNILHREERLFPQTEECSELSVACRRNDYSASRLAHAVEDVDAHLLNLNVTSEMTEDAEVVVDLRVNRRNAMPVARSLERYGYRVVDIRSAGPRYDETLSERVGELMLHINM